MVNFFKMSALSLVLATGMGLSQAQATTVLIDDFTTNMHVGPVIGPGSAASGALTYTNNTLNSALRDFTINQTTSGQTDVYSNTLVPGKLVVSSVVANPTVTLDYTFNPTDLTSLGTNSALILGVDSIDPNGVSVSIAVESLFGSGASIASSQSFFTAGQYFRNFADFTGTADFTQATRLTITLSGLHPDWDGTFSFLETNPTPSLPEPTSLSLLGLGFGILAARRRQAK